MRRWLVLSLAMLSINVSAQTKLTIEVCRQMALENNSRIKSALITKEKANYDYKSVRSNYFPKISGYTLGLFTDKSISYNFEGAYLPTFLTNPQSGTLVPNLLLDKNGQMIIGPDGNPVFKEYAMIPPMNLKINLNGSFTSGIKLEQPIFMGLKVRTGVKMANIGKEMSEYNTDLSKKDVVIEISEAYYQYLKVIELVRVSEKYLEAVSALEKRVKDAGAEGMALKNDLLKVQVKLNEAKLFLSKAQNGSILARMNLCNLIGLPLDESIILEDQGELMNITDMDVPMEQLMPVSDISNRADYKLLEKQVELKQQQIKLIRSGFLPQIGLSSNYGYMQGLKVGNENLLSSSSLSVIASISVPIYHWGEGKNKILSAKADLKIAEENQKHLENMMLLEEAKFRLAINDAILRIKMTEQSLAQASENVKLSSDRYEVGLENVTNFLESQAQWQKIYAEHVDAKIEYRLSVDKYIKASGR